MSTFVVHFIGDASQSFRGKVRHVATGQEIPFSGPEQLLAFFNDLNALSFPIGEGAGTEPLASTVEGRSPPRSPSAPRQQKRTKTTRH